MFPIQLPPQLCCLWRSSSQFGSKTSRNWMVATTFTSSSSWHYEGFWCGFSPDLPNRVAAPIWPLSGFHPPANWRWQPRVLNKKRNVLQRVWSWNTIKKFCILRNRLIGEQLKAAPLQGCWNARFISINPPSDWHIRREGTTRKPVAWRVLHESILGLLANWPPLPPPFSRMDPTFASNCCGVSQAWPSDLTLLQLIATWTRGWIHQNSKSNGWNITVKKCWSDGKIGQILDTTWKWLDQLDLAMPGKSRTPNDKDLAQRFQASPHHRLGGFCVEMLEGTQEQ